jgi:excinuclease UvrABC ATPase subunit
MPSLARPDVDVLEGLTTAIIVDQERMGANARSTVGTVTDANALLRILFSRLGQPHIGSPQAFSFNVPSVSGVGQVTVDEGRAPPPPRSAPSRHRRHVPALRGHGLGVRHRPGPALRRVEVARRGRDHGPGYTGDGWYVRIFGAVVPTDVPIARFSERQRQEFLYGEPRKVKVDNINLTYEGLVPKVQKSMLSKDVDAMQPHIRAFVERAVTFQTLPRLRRHAARRGRARSSKIAGISIADACAMQITDLAAWVRGLDAPSVAPLLGGLRHLLDSFVEIGLGYLSLERPSGTLSGGEAQRTKMIRHLGSSLTDVTYVFDEPTIGLHPHDIARMNGLLLRLRDKGNTVLVVEHKPEAIAIADHVVDLGPGAGAAGGEVVFEGSVEGLRASGTLTGRHLDDRARLKATVRTVARRARDPRRDDEQPAGRRRRHPARRAGGRDRRGGVGQELADPRLGLGPRRRRDRSTRARSAARGAATRRPTPGCSSRSARRSRRPTA